MTDTQQDGRNLLGSWIDHAWSGYADAWTRAFALSEVWSAQAGNAMALAALARLRADALVAHARRYSPFYAQHYRDAPQRAPFESLPVVKRSQLMKAFDDWATDRAITHESVEAFLSSADNIGQDYLGRYAVWTSSGTCGQRGIFLQPRNAMAVYDAELMARAGPGPMLGALLGAGGAGRLPAVLIAALEGHYAGVVTWRRLRAANPWWAPQMHAVSVMTPLDQMVASLNRIGPRFIAAYPSVLQSLAQEQLQGRLRIAPVLLWSGGEAMPACARALIESAFVCPLINDYAASECMSIGFECSQGSMHLNADWVILEPVDQQGQPVPDGQPSHTSLLTNLANPIQPIIRYDLGDSITRHAQACACGCPRPAYTVAGRAADVLHLPRADGSMATIFPLAIQGAIEEGANVTQFQVVQVARDRLLLRVGGGKKQLAASALKARAALREFLLSQGVGKVRVELDPTSPCAKGAGGKLRQVVALDTQTAR